MSERHPDWHVEVTNYGVQVVTHRHGDVEATAFLYSNPDEVWAECTMCGARLDLDDPTTLQRLSDRLRERRGVASG